MRVLYFTKYSRKGASSRLRSYQYFPFLKENGIEVEVSPLFNDVYLSNLYQGRSNAVEIIKSYAKRFAKLGTAFHYDKIVIEKELFPYFFSWFEWLLYFFGVKYIVDFDDAIFHNYDKSTNKLIRFFLSDKIDKVMRSSFCVTAGNAYLAKRAIKAGAKRVEIIPTVIDINRYSLKQTHIKSKLVIGWIGSPSTFQYVKEIESVLVELRSTYDIEVHIIGAKGNLDLGPAVKYIPWTESTEVAGILKFDIGIMPLKDTLWEKGKCAYKLIQYMACGIPVIASPIGMNVEVVCEHKNGFLASEKSHWLKSIEKYINDIDLRKIHGFHGRKIVENKFCLQVTQTQILQIIKGCY
jgi:glycosyltransferase involved in cell wall biosynthesis